MLRRARVGLGLLLLAMSILFLIWGYWPAHRERRVSPVSNAADLSPVEQRALTLLFPPKVRVGETAVARLTLDIDALQDFLPLTGREDILQTFATHNVIPEARFDLPGILVRPSELISAPVTQGQTAVFYWTLRPSEAGKFRGTIWLYLRLVDKLTGQESRQTISAQIVEIESIKFLGLVANQVRVIGLVGAVIGFLLSLPFWETLGVQLLRKRSKML